MFRNTHQTSAACAAVICLFGLIAFAPHAAAQNQDQDRNQQDQQQQPRQQQAQQQSGQSFDTPDDAVNALAEVVYHYNGDNTALIQLFGDRITEMLSGDERQDLRDIQRFSAALQRGYLLEEVDGDANRLHLVVGYNHWQFPAPLVKSGDQWRFDTAAGVEDVLDRRIGGNELDAIESCLLYLQAQNQYFEMDPDGDGVRTYAMNILSSPGKRDGLYWPEDPDDPDAARSPFGPLIAEAVEAGEVDLEAEVRPYRGYLFRILAAQGPSADGGAMSFADDSGRMTRSHALLAWPAAYGDTGITTFMVDARGVVYEQDLGDQTGRLVESIQTFDPTDQWQRVDLEALEQQTRLEDANAASVTGTVAYRQRMALPADAVVHVQLVDVSRADAPATVIAETRVPTEGRQPPIPFTLEFDPEEIEASSTYHLRASIHSGDRTLFTTTQAYPVLTGGGGDEVEMVLDQPGAAGDGKPAAGVPDLEDKRWQLTELNGKTAVESEQGPGAGITFVSAEQTIAANTGVNVLGGSYAVAADGLVIKPGAMTLMSGPDALMEQEKAFVAALKRATSYRLSGDTLQLLDEDTVLAVFERQE